MNIDDFIEEKSIKYGIQRIKIISLRKLIKIQNNLNLKNNLSVLNEYYPEYKSVIVGGLYYNYQWNNIKNNCTGYIARYTTANFYKMLRKKLKMMTDALHEKYYINYTKKKLFKFFINSNSIDEKFIAFAAGLGNYSKNSLIMMNNYGLQFVLGVVFVAGEFDIKESPGLNYNEIPVSKYCEKCSACIKSCPTDAFQNNIIDKNRCIQHLSSQKDWPDKIDNEKFIKLWGTRFFGCTNCIDICPQNKYLNSNNDELYGYIGKTLNLKRMLFKNKNYFEKRFSGNQLGARWIPTVIHIRNITASLYNLGEMELIKKFHKNINKYNWNEEDIKYIKNFIFFYLNCNGY